MSSASGGCNERSRSYTPQGGTILSPGRPARRAVQLTLDSVLSGNRKDDQAGVSRGQSSSPNTSEGPNSEQGKGPVCSSSVKNPKGGADGRRGAGNPDPNVDLLERTLSRENMIKACKRVKAKKNNGVRSKAPVKVGKE